jgi:hypothetical protein
LSSSSAENGLEQLLPLLQTHAGQLELAGGLGLGDAGGKQLGGAQPTRLEPVAFSLCRRAARDGWHGTDPHPPGSQPPT